MKILGLHASFLSNIHDPSACIVVDGTLVSAYEEERLNRFKSSPGLFPEKSVKASLKIAGLSIRDIDFVAIDGITSKHLPYKVNRYLNHQFGFCPPIATIHHAESHAAGAFLASGFPSALVVSVDGYGDGLSTLIYLRNRDSPDNKLVFKLKSPDSLGEFYTAFTNYLGFKSIEGEYKVMGMSAFGTPHLDLSYLLHFDPIKESIVFDRNILDHNNATSIFEPHCNSEYILNKTGVARIVHGEDEFSQCHFDLAASVQKAFSDTYVSLIKHFLNKTGQKYLCISGGCALNCLANMRFQDLCLDGIYVQPGASDRGLCIGNALELACRHGDVVEPVTSMYLGYSFSDSEIVEAFNRCSLGYEKISDPAKEAAESIQKGKVIGWFQGRSEFGPRALGHRSILASASIPGTKDKLNRKIKYREKFRPFAPAMLHEDFVAATGQTQHYPFMTFTFMIKSEYKNLMSEAVQIDGSARIQTVSAQDCNLFYRLLRYVKDRNGLGVVLNTSFNLAGEPIVDNPTDAIRTFVSSDIDELYIGGYRLKKNG